MHPAQKKHNLNESRYKCRVEISPLVLKKTLTFSLLGLALLFFTACGSSAEAEASPTLTPIQQEGEAVFRNFCASCHAIFPDTVIVGPSLSGIATRAQQRIDGMDGIEYLQSSILMPGSYVVEGFGDLMPKEFGKQLSGEQFDALLAYLLTLE